ncbi:hypothetical protein BGW39_000592 [Mortierella sp. 14UC]|nr:hypothetical protein BGW39_000592 [Mortierella sp. 14UC]
MSNDFLSLIANLNSESSPVMSSPEDYSAELSLWTNLQFTYDAPPGLGIFEQDSGFDALSALNTPAHHGITSASAQQQQQQQQPIALAPAPVAAAKGPTVGHNPQSAIDQKHLMEYLNLPQEDTRPLSLLERTRQRNPQQQLQQPQPVQQQQQQRQPSAVLPLLLPNIAPATAPTTPAAAKLLRQPLPQYKAANSTKKALKPLATPAAIAPAGVIAPKSPTTVNASAIAAAATAAAVSVKAKTTPLASVSNDKDKDDEHELSAADSFSRDDPDYQSKVAAEEDKRRRNTAASARFRYKKKLREQALEQTAKEQTLRAETLEARVKELEMEVKWLRGLIVEKDSHLHEATATIDEEQGPSKRIKLDTY